MYMYMVKRIEPSQAERTAADGMQGFERATTALFAIPKAAVKDAVAERLARLRPENGARPGNYGSDT